MITTEQQQKAEEWGRLHTPVTITIEHLSGDSDNYWYDPSEDRWKYAKAGEVTSSETIITHKGSSLDQYIQEVFFNEPT